MSKKLTTEEFIEKAKKIHGDKYDYSRVEYVNSKTKTEFICKFHGSFWQTPGNHLLGKGCKLCKYENQSKVQRLTTKEFIEKAKEIHGDKYDYSRVEYEKSTKKVEIICSDHGSFWQTPGKHLSGQGCPKCNSKRKLTTKEFIEKAKEIHGDKYDYSHVEYINIGNKIEMICYEHGSFWQTPLNHLNGRGCPKCANISRSKSQQLTTEEFIEKATKIHGNTYDYSMIKYNGTDKKSKFICRKHGIFMQTPDNHLQGNGCPKCAHIISKQELEIQDWLSGYIDIEKNNRNLISPFELDIVIPDKKIAIEYNGLFWHSEQQGKDKKYHLNKYLKCKENGYRLIQIWENEWLYKQDIVKSIILNAIGINKNTIHGRKCIVKRVSPQIAKSIYNENHIQGFKGGIHHALYYNDEIVSLMTIDKRGELQRFVNKIHTKVHGAFSKLLKSFIDNYEYDEIFTFADIRYFSGNVYINNNFEYLYRTKPNYYYIVNNKTIHRRNYQKKYIKYKYYKGLLDFYSDHMTEYENMVLNGYDRIWDCGNNKYIYKV